MKEENKDKLQHQRANSKEKACKNTKNDSLFRLKSWLVIKKQIATDVFESDGIIGLLMLAYRFAARRISGRYLSGGFLLKNNKDGYIPYDSEYQNNISYENKTTDIKALAFYLPQFHTFQENDEWWGEGFTEWSNTRKCTEPRFKGHYQPRTPHEDIGFYDLADFEVLRRQSQLAKQHGIFGFCFYYYWFSGKRLMEKPVDQLLKHPEVDLPFCLCWANENWTRAWDGQNNSILIEQEYSQEDDSRFIHDIKKYIDDPRYIRIHGKPVIIVYNPGQIPCCKSTFTAWRENARELGVGEILIWVCATSNNSVEKLKLHDLVDAEVEFPPHNMWYESIAVSGLNLEVQRALIFNYQLLVTRIERELRSDEHKNPVPLYRTCTMGWDNSARRKKNWFTLYAFSLKYLYRWMRAIIKRTRSDFEPEERFLFINAWNEWAEGTYLEPDEEYGYANINTISKALFDLPFKQCPRVLSENSPSLSPELFQSKGNVTPRIAIQIHMFYTETLGETIEQLNKIPFNFDCYVSTDTNEKRDLILTYFYSRGQQKKLQVDVFSNRGRDVAPFIQQISKVIDLYNYVGHFHSKMTTGSEYGNDWRKYSFKHLLGNEANIQRIFWLFENDSELGLIFPETYPVLKNQAEWGGNYKECTELLKAVGYNKPLPSDPIFPVGNMFWARTKAIKPFFNGILNQEHFPEERGQKNATLAHCIERSWVYLAQKQGYSYLCTFNNCNEKKCLQNKRRLCIYVHYDAMNTVSDEDIKMLDALKAVSEMLVMISNSSLPTKIVSELSEKVDHIFLRENEGFDFAAWRDAMNHIGFSKIEEFDELILANNSITGPVLSINEMFHKMEENQSIDFWGVLLYPHTTDGSYLNLKYIPEHIQSYFQVFSQKVIKSEIFQSFWKNIDNCKEIKSVIGKYEVRLTGELKNAGFNYAPYIVESKYLASYINSPSIPYEYPYQLLLLGMPFVKKKYIKYASDEEKFRLQSFLEQLE